MFLFYFIYFGLLAQWEDEMNSCDGCPSKRIPLKVMREATKRKRGKMQGEIGKESNMN
jgi:hypothetical protein